MGNIFDTTEEAEKALAKLRKEYLKKFCPILRAHCREDCASFNAGRVITKYDQSAGVSTPECENVIVRGYIYHEGDGNVHC